MATDTEGGMTNVETSTCTNGSLHQNDQSSRSGTKSVIIVGAGPVGLFLALKLGKAKVDVTVLEKEPDTVDAPRACGYFAASALAMREVGIYDKVREEGFMTRGICWRKKPVDDGAGGKRLGDVIAVLPLAAPDDDVVACPAGLLNLQQGFLNKLLLREALATGNVTVLFDRCLTSIEEDEEGCTVTVTTEDIQTGSIHRDTASFLVGADGARSTARKLLGIPFLGHTWPERLVATDVTIQNHEMPDLLTHYVLDEINYTVVTPLTVPVRGKPSLWRCTIASAPDDPRSDEELSSDQSIANLYELVLSGPRPLQYKIERRSVYRIHQRLAVTLRRGRSLLAGDAAHLCNPYGALGLNSGILDADALGEALIMILNEGHPLSLLDIYSDQRRKVFQTFIDPTSTHNKLRVHGNHQDVAARDDWFFRTMANPSPETLLEQARPYFEDWPTDMRKLAKSIKMS